MELARPTEGGGGVTEERFEDGRIRLICGDSLDDMHRRSWIEVGPFALVTDPPYGINHQSNQVGPLQGRGIEGDGDTAARDAWVQWADLGRAPAIVFGTWKIAKPEGTHMTLYWDKGGGVGMGDTNFPWKPTAEEIYLMGRKDGFRPSAEVGRHQSVLRFTMVSWVSKGRSHPNQKPVDLMRHLIDRLDPELTIIDPFMGSGATMRAAADLGRKGIGIEFDPEHFKTACEAMAQTTLFTPEPQVEQPSLLA